MNIFKKIRAHFRAKRLFFDSLTPLEKDYLYAYSTITVIGNLTKCKYLVFVNRGVEFNIWRPTDNMWLCFTPKGNLPYWDVIMAQKLMLESNEKEVLEKANKGRRRSVDDYRA